MQYSHSKVECANSCHYKYKLRYIDKLKTIDAPEANNPLICGNTIHLGAEKGLNAALEFYYGNFPVISDLHINEVIKFEYWIPKLRNLLRDINVYKQEYRVSNSRFIGIADLITRNEDGTIDIFDFKYSNNVEKYLNSAQLHLYKYFLEREGFRVRRLGFIFIPKISIRQKKTENLYQFRKRLNEELRAKDIQLLKIKYDPDKVIEFHEDIIKINEIKDYEKNPTNLCSWCDYEEYCLKGNDYMILPSSERRDITKTSKRKIWIYGAAFSGKTTMLDESPNPLNINTDGNIQFVTMPYIAIKDEVTVEGRMTKRKLAWEVFKDTILELEKKQNDFKTIIIDLLEDTREMCRIFKYNELGIEHESDSGFGKGWDIIKTEYLSTIRRFFNLDYENLVVISHEDVSKDITKKNGQNVTRIAPNIQEAIANKIAGMVDIVARVVVDGDERTLNFKSDEVIFGGGRLKGITHTSIPLKWDELMKVYDEANKGKKDAPKVEDNSKIRNKANEEVVEMEEDQAVKEVAQQEEGMSEEVQTEEKPKRRRGRRKASEE